MEHESEWFKRKREQDYCNNWHDTHIAEVGPIRELGRLAGHTQGEGLMLVT